MTSQATELKRTITTTGATAIVVGSMLGAGIFLAPALVASYTTSVAAYLAYWLIGGLTALAGAASFAELGAMMPRSGGEYAFLQRAFGNSVALAAGWTLVLIVFPGSIASMVSALTQYQVLPWINAWSGNDYAVTSALGTGLNIGIILLLTLLNIAGARLSSSAQTVIVALPLGILTVLAFVGLAFAPEAQSSARYVPVATDVLSPTSTSLSVFALAFMATYFAYSGWNAAGYVAGEVKDPARNVPRALLIGTTIVTVLYLLLSWFFVQTLGLEGLRQAPEAGTASVVAWLGQAHGAWMSIPIALGVLASVNSSVLSGARITYALSEDELLPPFLGRVSRRNGSPHVALWFQALVSIVLVLTGTFNELLMLTSLTMLIIGAAAVSALLYLRRREPHAERPFRVPFYPWVPLVYLVGCLVVIGSQFHTAILAILQGEDESRSHTYVLAGVLAFVSIIVLHALWQRFNPAAPTDSSPSL